MIKTFNPNVDYYGMKLTMDFDSFGGINIVICWYGIYSGDGRRRGRGSTNDVAGHFWGVFLYYYVFLTMMMGFAMEQKPCIVD